MGAVVHPHVCTVEVPYPVPGEQVTDDILMVSYHNQGEASAIDALLLPCRGLGKQPAPTVLAIPTEDPINPLADNTPPSLPNSPGNKSESGVPINEVIAALSGNPTHQSAGNAALIPHHNPEDQSAVKGPGNPSNGTTHQAADDDHLERSLTQGGPVTEPILVTPHSDSEDKSAEITSSHYPRYQPLDDTSFISDHHQEEKDSEDKPETGSLTVSQKDQADHPSNKALVISCQEAEVSPANEVFQTRESVFGKPPSDDDQSVSFHNLGPETPDEAPTASANKSADKPSGTASLERTHETEQSLESDALLATENETENAHVGEILTEPLHDSEHKITDENLVSDRLEDKSAKHAFGVFNHKLNGEEEDESLLVTNDTLESNHSSDAVMLPDASGPKNTDEVVLSSDHGSGKQRDDEVYLTLSYRPEDRPLDNVLLASSHDSDDPSAGESLVISYHDLEAPPTKDDLLIISNTLNHQPASDTDLALLKESNNQPEDGLLVVSPYDFAPHLLRLSTVSKPNQLLAQALTQMRAVRDDYATAAYIKSFNWSYIVESVKNLSKKAAYEWQPEVFYIVVFRSRVDPMTNRLNLGLMDAKAHEEAMESGGLLKYWFGVPDANCRNLATCKFSQRLFGMNQLSSV